MTMEIDKSNQAHSINGEQRTKDLGDDEDQNEGGGGDSDSDAITCPLFMEGLPSNFSTNPQLAAIASLLEDDVREEIVPKDDKTEEENDTKDKSAHASKNQQHRPPSSTPYTASSHRHLKNSAKTRNRRQPQRASPYPRPQDRKDEKQAKATKSSSVGEITLFMNMWKP